MGARHYYAVEMGVSLLTGKLRPALVARFDTAEARNQWIGEGFPPVRGSARTNDKPVRDALRYAKMGFDWPIRI